MIEVFVDTFYWIALLDPRDQYHQRAVQVPRPPRMVTTQAVRLEVMNTWSAVPVRELAVEFWRETNSNPDLVVVPLDNDLIRRGAELFERRADKNWSLTDCISFLAMEDRGITEALTGDHHFEQAGFRIAFE